ncbi:hypothetical protein MNBD_PLANCTO02-316, partial [hydrothermal vent metagenome]
MRLRKEQSSKRFRFIAALLLTTAFCLSSYPVLVPVQGAEKNSAEKDNAESKNEDGLSKRTLSEEQGIQAKRYKRFETTLESMAKNIEDEDPAKAAFIRRILKKSQSDRIARRLESLTTMLKDGDASGDILEQQDTAINDMKNLLKRLQDYDKKKENQERRKQLEKLLREINNRIKDEKRNQMRVARGDSPEKIEGKEKKNADKTQDIVDGIKKHDGDPKEGKPMDGDPKEGKPMDGDPKEGKPMDGDPKEGKPMDGDPKEGKPKEDSESDDKKTPGKEDLEKALEEMKRAIEELKKKNLDNASDAQGDAIDNLIKAKEKIEELLKQLREEERELLLAALEARFAKMLKDQKKVKRKT